MAFSVRHDTFRAALATGVQSLGGFGFAPKAVVMWHGLNVTAGTFATNAHYGLGWGTSSADNRAAGFGVAGGVTTTNAGRRWHQSLAVIPGADASVQMECQVSTLWSDGFNVNWSTAAASRWMHYLALGGADLTNVSVGVFSLSTVTGTQTVVGLGFQPDVVLLLTAQLTAALLGSSLGNAQLSFGVAKSSTQRWSWGMTAADNQTTTALVDAMRTQRADSILIGLTTTAAADFQVNHTSMLADGFSVNVIDAPASAYNVAYLALKGGSYDVNVFAKSTAAAPVSQAVTVGFSAAALLLSTFQIASTTTITGDTNTDLGAGDFVRASNAWQGIADAALSSAQRVNAINPILTCASRAIGTVIFQGSLTGLVASGFNVTWTTNDGIAAQIGYIAFGDAVSTFMFRNRERTQLRM